MTARPYLRTHDLALAGAPPILNGFAWVRRPNKWVCVAQPVSCCGVRFPFLHGAMSCT